jgi:hypothetical protein
MAAYTSKVTYYHNCDTMIYSKSRNYGRFARNPAGAGHEPGSDRINRRGNLERSTQGFKPSSRARYMAFRYELTKDQAQR